MDLPDIPLIEAPQGPTGLLAGQDARIARLLDCAHGRLPGALLNWGDRYARTWLEQSGNPYLGELGEIAGVVGRPGCYALNFSFEWLCTAGCGSAADGAAPGLYRTLDWVFAVGADAVVGRHEGEAGGYCSVTWPGYVGVLTGLAAGRFAAALNQAPMPYALGRWSLGLPLDWLVNRRRVARRRDLPPSHLLRQVFETCRSYGEAKEMLARTPLCIPAIFALAGTSAGECCVIERMEEKAAVHEGAGVAGVAAANHWITPRFHGRPRPWKSRQRRAAMLEFLKAGGGGAWLQTPILNRNTCLMVEMNAASGCLLVQGMAGEKAVTRRFILR